MEHRNKSMLRTGGHNYQPSALPEGCDFGLIGWTFRAADVHLPGTAAHLNKGQSSSEFSWFAEAL